MLEDYLHLRQMTTSEEGPGCPVRSSWTRRVAWRGLALGRVCYMGESNGY